ncbi:MAG: hypothetical protein RSC75_11890 [Bacteroidales bacterium]
MNLNNIFKGRLLFALLAFTALFSCSEDKITELDGQGKVVFQFNKINVFEVDAMDQIGSIIVTVEKDGIRTTLPSLEVNGRKDSLYTPALNMEPGVYSVTGYKIFAKNASKIADIDLDKDNRLVIEEGRVALFDLFVDIKIIYDAVIYRNVMIGICKEAFGDDKSKWPIDPEKEVTEWSCFEFEEDEVTGTIYQLNTVIFDESFMGMKKLPVGLGSLATVNSLIFRNFDLEELPDDIANMVSLKSISITDTNLKSIPKTLERSRIIALSIVNSDITEFPAELGKIEGMRLLDLSGNKLTSVPAEIGNYSNMVQFRLNEQGITELPDMFANLDKLDLLDVSVCQLSSLPPSIAQAARLKTIFMDDCNITTIPEIIGQTPQLMWVTLRNNKISAIDPALFSGATSLNTIHLCGNPLAELPVLPLPALEMIAINGCRFTQVPDLGAYSGLRQFEMKNNPITSLPEGFLRGTSLTKLILSDNVLLTTVPADLGVDLVGGVPKTLKYVNIENCPKLNWSAPVAWGSTVVIRK